MVLRVAQEALQNVRKHAAAVERRPCATRIDGGRLGPGGRATTAADSISERWRREAAATSDLQFMRERAELIGARLDVRSRPDGGTVVRLAIPTRARTGGEESR